MKTGLLALILLLPAFAAAQEETGNDLLRNCSFAVKLFDKENVSSEDFIKIGGCTGIIAGVMQTAGLWKASAGTRQSKEPVKDLCAPDVSVEQVVRIVVKRLKSHPEELDLEASVVVLRVMSESFPSPACVVDSGKQAEGLHWPDPPKKQQIRVRLIAVALADHPRSSFFSSQEVFVAETDIGDEGVEADQTRLHLPSLSATALGIRLRLLSGPQDFSLARSGLRRDGRAVDSAKPPRSL